MWRSVRISQRLVNYKFRTSLYNNSKKINEISIESMIMQNVDGINGYSIWPYIINYSQTKPPVINSKEYYKRDIDGKCKKWDSVGEKLEESNNQCGNG